MKEQITLNNWRFEFLKDPSTDWVQLRIGGFYRDINNEEKSLVEAVTDLQGFNEKPQFKKGYKFETANHTIILGTQENWKK